MVSGRDKRAALRRQNSAQLARQWAILKLLETKEYSIRELADELATSKSSVQRDLATLQEHFMIVTHQVGEQKRVYGVDGPQRSGGVRIRGADGEAV
jgi:predicted DNA-binding transcriptional regulator YafY